MANGDQQDFLSRLRSLLPPRWFPLPTSPKPATYDSITTNDGSDLTDGFGNSILGPVLVPAQSPISQTPILDTLLAGLSSAWVFLYGLVVYSQLQVRIATATDVWLDIISVDYFGDLLPRKINESDSAFSARIRGNIFPPLQTRAALSQALTTLTGRAPKIFEPANPMDAGAYNLGYTAYNVAGGYGCLTLPFQLFVTAYRQNSQGFPNIGGYSGQNSTPPYVPGGYCFGALEYASIERVGTQIADAEIYQTVASFQAAGVTAWTAISN